MVIVVLVFVCVLTGFVLGFFDFFFAVVCLFLFLAFFGLVWYGFEFIRFLGHVLRFVLVGGMVLVLGVVWCIWVGRCVALLHINVFFFF